MGHGLFEPLRQGCLGGPEISEKRTIEGCFGYPWDVQNCELEVLFGGVGTWNATNH